MFWLFEIPLQFILHHCSQINSLSSKTVFVTSAVSIGYKGGCKRRPFALQNMPFYTSKDALLQGKRASFRTQKGVDWKTEGKEIDKEGRRTYKKGSPRPKEKEPTQAPLEEGMWEETVGYGWLTKPRVTASPSPSEGGDVPRGIRNEVCWRDGGRKF